MGKKKEMKKFEKNLKKLGDALCSASPEERAKCEEELQNAIREIKELVPSSRKEAKIKALVVEQFNRAGIRGDTPPSPSVKESPKLVTPPASPKTPHDSPEEKSVAPPTPPKASHNPPEEKSGWASVWQSVRDLATGLSWVNHPIITGAKEFSADMAEKIARKVFGCEDEALIKKCRANVKVLVGVAGRKATLDPIGLAKDVVDYIEELREAIEMSPPDVNEHFGHIDPDHPIKGMKAGEGSYKATLQDFDKARRGAIDHGKEIGKKIVDTGGAFQDGLDEMSKPSKSGQADKAKKRKDSGDWGFNPGDPTLL